MSETVITCPQCGAEIPLTQAVTHHLREQLDAEFQRRLSQERQKWQDAAARAAEEKLSLHLRDLQAQLAAEKQKRQAAEALELQLRQQQRELEEARQRQELELARRLGEERAKIREAALQQAAEAERLKLAEREKQIADLQAQIAALKQRAEQGSMQLQGETLEITLEADLRAAFPFDEIAEIKKGQRGGDCLQTVRTNQGLPCGAILWEAKRAKNWSADWPGKLKDDQRDAKADLAVLVTTCPPAGLRGIGFHDGVWVCELPFAIGLATALRQGLIATAIQRVQQQNSAEKAQLLYQHLCGNEFRQHIQALVEAFLGLKDQLDAERRAFERQWKEREAQLAKAITHTARLYGGIQGIAGREALPEIPHLALPSPPAPQPLSHLVT